MDKKTFGIGILGLMAVILIVANYLPLPQPSASAGVSVKDTLSEYQMVTAHNVEGGDSLYIINRDGKMAVFQYDPTARALKLVATRAVEDLVGGH
jgi:hypothetical protein